MSDRPSVGREITNRLTGDVLHRSETAETLREAVVEAVRAGADLRHADLRGADLLGADLRGADLSGADLSCAGLRGAGLSGADLSGADLRCADLRDADLRGADLRGADLRYADLRYADLRDADLRDADLRDADLRDADLREADLREADLRPIREDFCQILDARPAEVRGLLQALQEGRVDGSTYEGECACLVGTLAHVAGCDYRQLEGLAPDAARPAERFFLAIRPGDTPETSQPAAIAAEWIREWLDAPPEEISGA